MKKTYFEPTVNVIAVEIKNTLLTASDPKAQSLSIDGETIDNGSSIGSRRSSIWGDDEE